MNYSIEKSLIIAVTDEGNEFANSEHCDNLCIAAEYDDAIRVLYRASDFDEDRKNAYDSWEFLPIDDCPMDFGDGNAGTVAIAKIELGCGTRFIVFEGTQYFGSDFDPASQWDAETNSNAADGQIERGEA